MKIDFKIIVLSLLCFILLSSCASSGDSQTSRLTIGEEIRQFEQSYIEEAKKVLADFDLSGDAKMVKQYFENYHLVVESSDFEALPNQTKVVILKKLNEISVENANWALFAEVNSHENRYTYSDFFAELDKNGEKIFPPSDSTSSSSPSISASGSWFSGGTLHKSTVAEWRKAPYSNRLATSADFIAATQDVDYGDLNEFKLWATDLENCISIAVSGGNVDSELVSFVSALCKVQLFP